MSAYTDELDSLLDDIDFGEFDERVRRNRSVRTPSNRSSFQPRQTPSPASQGQVQAAARNLDGKIETLSNAIKAVEARANAIAAETDRATSALRKEIADRRKSGDVTRAELQQTKLLSVVLPMLSTQTLQGRDENNAPVQVLAPSSNQLAQFLPFVLLFGGLGGDPSKGGLGDSTTLLLLILLFSKR